MVARYREVATDLRARLMRGEWPVGAQLPTIAQLQAEYDVRALNTIRSAQAILVDEGLVETVAGRGVFVRQIPAADAAVQVRELLEAIRDQAGVALAAVARRPVAARLDTPQQPATEAWGYMQLWECRTCGASGGTTRGWVPVEDYYDAQFDHGGHDAEDDHDLLVSYGSHSDDQAAAWARERWWEHRAYLERASERLLEGDAAGASDAAARAQRVQHETPAIEDLAVNLGPSAPSTTGAEPAEETPID